MILPKMMGSIKLSTSATAASPMARKSHLLKGLRYFQIISIDTLTLLIPATYIICTEVPAGGSKTV
jgi:hypothetical protein